jgi:hypothetical protein
VLNVELILYIVGSFVEIMNLATHWWEDLRDHWDVWWRNMKSMNRDIKQQMGIVNAIASIGSIQTPSKTRIRGLPIYLTWMLEQVEQRGTWSYQKGSIKKDGSLLQLWQKYFNVSEAHSLGSEEYGWTCSKEVLKTVGQSTWATSHGFDRLWCISHFIAQYNFKR